MSITPAVEAALKAPHHEYAHFLVMELNGVTLRYTDASMDLEWNGDTFLGDGMLMGVEDITRTAELTVNQTSITVSVADQSLLALLLQNNQKGRPVRIYKAFFDDSGIIPDPVLLYWGETSGIATKMGVYDGFLKVKISGPFAQWSRKRGRRTTDASQQSVYPGDLGMEFATQVKTDLKWGGE